MTIPCFSDNSTSASTGATPPTDTPPTPHNVTTHTGDISSLPSTLTTPTSNTDVTFSNPTPLSTSSTVSQVVSVKSCTSQLLILLPQTSCKYINFIIHAIPTAFCTLHKLCKSMAWPIITRNVYTCFKTRFLSVVLAHDVDIP